MNNNIIKLNKCIFDYIFLMKGNHCEMNINDCMHNPCVNNGTCIDGVKDYSCKCYTGYTGNIEIILIFGKLND